MSRRRKTNRKELVIPINHTKEEFNFEKVKELATRNGLKVYLKGNENVIEVKSKVNSWIIPLDDRETIRLYHLTKDGSKHFQREFLDFEFLLNSIRTHDIFKTEEDKGNRIFNMFKVLETGNIPRVSFN